MRVQSGLYSEGEAWPDMTPFRIEQPGYALWDAMARYDVTEATSLQLNIDNLFDKDYYTAIGETGYGNFIGQGRSAAVVLRHAF